MIARQVGEHPGSEREAVESPLVKAVGGRLHRDVRRARREQRRERAWRSIGPGVVSDPAVESTGSPRPSNAPSVPMLPAVCARVEQVADDAGGGRLPVRTGHADERQPPRRLAEPRLPERERGPPAVPHDDLRHARAAARPLPRRPSRRVAPRRPRTDGRPPAIPAPPRRAARARRRGFRADRRLARGRPPGPSRAGRRRRSSSRSSDQLRASHGLRNRLPDLRSFRHHQRPTPRSARSPRRPARSAPPDRAPADSRETRGGAAPAPPHEPTGPQHPAPAGPRRWSSEPGTAGHHDRSAGAARAAASVFVTSGRRCPARPDARGRSPPAARPAPAAASSG